MKSVGRVLTAVVRAILATLGFGFIVALLAVIAGFIVGVVSGDMFGPTGPGLLGALFALVLIGFALLGGAGLSLAPAYAWSDTKPAQRVVGGIVGVVLLAGALVGVYFLPSTEAVWAWVYGATALSVIGMSVYFFRAKPSASPGRTASGVVMPGHCVTCAKYVPPDTLTYQAPTSLGLRPICSAACKDRWVRGLDERGECAMCGATGNVAVRGGMKEPYCSQACYDRAGRLLADDMLRQMSPNATIHGMR